MKFTFSLHTHHNILSLSEYIFETLLFSSGPGGREGILGGHQQQRPPHPQGGQLPPRGQDGQGGQRVRMGPIGEKKST